MRDQKASGTSLLPSRELEVNAAWLTATTLAADLRCWFQLLALDGELAKATPKTLRYRILHVPARLVHGQRKRRLSLDPPTKTGPEQPSSRSAAPSGRSAPSPLR
ncbi:transposase [Streptomyces incanus]|uniref:Transposase n=1 Tax=Streptomyces incanus TaxID=887453 RepID=A0ABW0XS04_9ACTN